MYDLLLDSVSAGVISVDVEGRITDANPRACNELGYSREELVGQDGHSRLHDSHSDGSLHPRAHCVFVSRTRDPPPDCGDVLWRKDGSCFEVEHTAIEASEGGTPKGMVLLFHNVSARRASERELRETQRFYQALADNSPDMISLVDLDGMLLFASKSHEKILGYAAGELVGRPIAAILDPDNLERRLETIARALEDDRTALMRDRIRRKDGSFVPVKNAISIIRSDEHGTPRVLFTIRHPSERAGPDE